jgi:hypothetical protein
MVAQDAMELEWMLNRFRRLLGELFRGATIRNCFQQWEVDILVDIQTCELPHRRRLEILRQYQRAVERQMEIGPGPPMKLSEYLARRSRR